MKITPPRYDPNGYIDKKLYSIDFVLSVLRNKNWTVPKTKDGFIFDGELRYESHASKRFNKSAKLEDGYYCFQCEKKLKSDSDGRVFKAVRNEKNSLVCFDCLFKMYKVLQFVKKEVFRLKMEKQIQKDLRQT